MFTRILVGPFVNTENIIEPNQQAVDWVDEHAMIPNLYINQ